jgi:hypothetical protein
MKKILVVLLILSFHLFGFGNSVSFSGLSSLSNKPPKIFTLIDLVFENDSDTILKGKKITQKLIEYEILKNLDYTSVEIICYSFLKEYDEKQKNLNIKRAERVRDILIKTKLISRKKISINEMNQKPKKKHAPESYTIKIKLNFNESLENSQNPLIIKDKTQTIFTTFKNKNQIKSKNNDSISDLSKPTPKSDTKMSVILDKPKKNVETENEKKQQKKKLARPNKETDRKSENRIQQNERNSESVDFRLSLREADIVVVTIKNKLQKVVNKFSEEFDKSGIVNISVPTNDLLPGKYTITMVGLNGAFAKGEIEKK